jgi:hypothetical protein
MKAEFLIMSIVVADKSYAGGGYVKKIQIGAIRAQ